MFVIVFALFTAASAAPPLRAVDRRLIRHAPPCRAPARRIVTTLTLTLLFTRSR
jgi:hypothetical protein